MVRWNHRRILVICVLLVLLIINRITRLCIRTALCFDSEPTQLYKNNFALSCF